MRLNSQLRCSYRISLSITKRYRKNSSTLPDLARSFSTFAGLSYWDVQNADLVSRNQCLDSSRPIYLQTDTQPSRSIWIEGILLTKLKVCAQSHLRHLLCLFEGNHQGTHLVWYIAASRAVHMQTQTQLEPSKVNVTCSRDENWPKDLKAL